MQMVIHYDQAGDDGDSDREFPRPGTAMRCNSDDYQLHMTTSFAVGSGTTQGT